MIVENLRKADRFLAVEPIPGTFGPSEALILDLSLGGAQISHGQPVRIGTLARLAFRFGDVIVATQTRVLWSHLAPGKGGKMNYRTGLKIEAVDAQYAMAINSLLRTRAVRQDKESLEKKREREMVREEKRRSGPKPIPGR